MQPLFAEGASVGRHQLLRAVWEEDDGTSHGCVLKGFGHGDEKRLRRELGVLARLRHPNILQLQAVCKRNDPPCYFLQVARHPCNLKQALLDAGAAGAREAETKEDRRLRLAALLRGLLEGVHFLHQVHSRLEGCGGFGWRA